MSSQSVTLSTSPVNCVKRDHLALSMRLILDHVHRIVHRIADMVRALCHHPVFIRTRYCLLSADTINEKSMISTLPTPSHRVRINPMVHEPWGILKIEERKLRIHKPRELCKTSKKRL